MPCICGCSECTCRATCLCPQVPCICVDCRLLPLRQPQLSVISDSWKIIQPEEIHESRNINSINILLTSDCHANGIDKVEQVFMPIASLDKSVELTEQVQSHLQSKVAAKCLASKFSHLESCESDRSHPTESCFQFKPSTYKSLDNSSFSSCDAQSSTHLSENMNKLTISAGNDDETSLTYSTMKNMEAETYTLSAALRNISQMHVPWLPGGPSSIASEQPLDAKDLPVSPLIMPETTSESSNDIIIDLEKDTGKKASASTSPTGSASFQKTNVGAFKSSNPLLNKISQIGAIRSPRKRTRSSPYKQSDRLTVTRQQQPGVNPITLTIASKRHLGVYSIETDTSRQQTDANSNFGGASNVKNWEF